MATSDRPQGSDSTAINRENVILDRLRRNVVITVGSFATLLAVLAGKIFADEVSNKNHLNTIDTAAISELTKNSCPSLGKPDALEAQAITLGANPGSDYSDVAVAKKGNVLLLDDNALTAARIDQICALWNALKDPSKFVLIAPNMKDPASIAALRAAHITFVSDAKHLPKNITQLSQKLSPDSLVAFTGSAVTQGIASAYSALEVIPKGQLAQIPRRNIASIARV